MKTIMQRMLSIVLFIFFFSNDDVYAQLSAYHGIVRPYESSNRLPQTLGGITAAIPDFISDAQMNPAGLVSYNFPQFSVNAGFNKASFKMDSGLRGKPDSFTEHSFYNGNFSASFPAHIFKKRIALGISVSKINTPEFEIWEGMNEENLQQIYHTRNGDVFNGTIGIAGELSDNFSLGLSMTKWFGHWSWHDEDGPGDINGRGKFKYNGNSYTLGLLYQREKFSIGAVLYSPFTLMTSDQIQITSYFGKSTHNIKQRFKGAARLGAAYHINPQITIGAGYRYQGSIIMEDQMERESDSNTSTEDKYGKSHQISLGGEYTLSFNELQFPVFLAYQTSWTSKTQANYSPLYQYLSPEDGKKLSHSLMSGINLHYKSYGAYLTAQWNYRTINVSNGFVPPYS